MSSRDPSPSPRGGPRKVLLGPPPGQASKRPLLQSPPYKRPLLAEHPGWINRDEPPAKRPPLLPTPHRFQPRPPPQQPPQQQAPPPPPPLPPPLLPPPPPRRVARGGPPHGGPPQGGPPTGLLPHPARPALLPCPGDKRPPLLQTPGGPGRYREPLMKRGLVPPRRPPPPQASKRPLLPTPRIKC